MHVYISIHKLFVKKCYYHYSVNKDRVTPQSTHKHEHIKLENTRDKNTGVNQQH